MNALQEALAAERDGRYLESFGLCQQALAAQPHDADALNLLGRLCLLGGDLAGAVAMQRAALRLVPTHAEAKRDLERARAAIPSVDEAAACFVAALERAPEIACHHPAPPTLEPFWGMHHVRALLERGSRLDPTHAGVLAALGNVMVREVNYTEAIAMYRRAVMLEPEFAQAQLALSELLSIAHDRDGSEQHRAWALQLERHYAPCPITEEHPRTRVLMLMRDAAYSVNTPLEIAVDARSIAIGRLYVDPDADPGVYDGVLAQYHVLFDAMGYAEKARPALQALDRLIERTELRVINRPHVLARTSRVALAQALAGIEGCRVVPYRRVDCDALLGAIEYPSVLRPIDTHAGEGFDRVRNADELAAYLEHVAAPSFDVAPYVEYRSADGYYRKYRVLLVDGVAYPYHLAISPDWMVHFRTSPMAQHPWMMREEEAFLSDPHRVIPRWESCMEAIAKRLELEYVGLDFTVLSDGSVLVFEADAALLIHDEDSSGVFAYKCPYLERMFLAIERLLTH